jgi:hypothetical protein
MPAGGCAPKIGITTPGIMAPGMPLSGIPMFGIPAPDVAPADESTGAPMRAAFGFANWAIIASLAAAFSAAPKVVSAEGRYGVRDGLGCGGVVGRFAASGIIGAEVELIGDPFGEAARAKLSTVAGV